MDYAADADVAVESSRQSEAGEDHKTKALYDAPSMFC